MGLSPGQKRSANALLTITAPTPGLSLSVGVNDRPARSGIFNASKYPGDVDAVPAQVVMWASLRRCSTVASSNASAVQPYPPWNGSSSDTPAACTPPSARIL